jgi:nucleotide-binding universal stress UspA family protein
VTVVLGYTADQSGRAALDLGVQLARSSKESLLAATVVPAHWPIPSMARVDGEFAQWADSEGARQTAQARSYLAKIADGVPFDVRYVSGKSIPRGLVAVADENDGELLVVGSSDDGRHGRISLGSTADWLLHSSPVPVAIAPRGYRPTRGCAVSRVTCAYAATRGAAAVLRLAATFSARSGARLRIATFGVRGRTMYPPEVGLRVEDQVLDQWREQAVRAQGEALKELGQEELLPPGTVTEVGVGDNWTEALEDLAWLPDEVLLIGSSARGPISRVFLGSRATKIVRHSPVPVVVVPSAEIAEEAAERLAG